MALVSDARVRQLNARYRAKNSPTDVLSFTAGEPGFLGEIVIASGVASRQARRAGHPFQVELRVLALHGLLHELHDVVIGAVGAVEVGAADLWNCNGVVLGRRQGGDMSNEA